MCAPLLTHDRTLGVVFAGSTSGRVPLKEHHLHLLTVIANLAAVAIDQGHLRQRVEEELVLRSRLTRYHSPTLVDELLADSEGRGAMPPMERDVLVLFADIVGFSTRTEHMAPAQVSRLLNGLFPELVEIIFAHGGTLEKCLGDGLMAIFGAPNDLPDHPRRAVECAMAMQKRVMELDVHEGADEPVRLRIGTNSGMAVAGDIGSARRVEYTVLGNTVNVTARLEAFVARPGETAIGPGTHAALGDAFATELLGPQTLKGIGEAIPAYRVIGERSAEH
jgi:adenylate cyclase